MPILWEREPELVLHVVGADPTPAVEALHGERINVVGYVEDPAEWLRPHPCPRQPDALRRRDQARAPGHDRRRAALRDDGGRRGGPPARRLRAQLVAEEPLRLAELTHALYTDESSGQAQRERSRLSARSSFDRGTFRARRWPRP